MKLTLYQIDAFAEKLFTGNPAAVIPLKNGWMTLMQQLEWKIIWPKPFSLCRKIMILTSAGLLTLEINLCGHATLASAFVLFSQLNYQWSSITFHSKVVRNVAGW